MSNSVVVLVADDNTGDVAKTSPTTLSAQWRFQNNSDGGAIGTFLSAANVTLTIAPTTIIGTTNDRSWINGDEALTALNLPQTVEITAFSTPSS